MRLSNTVLFCAHYTMIAGTLVLKGFTADSNHIHKFPQREVSVDQPLWLSSLCLFQEKTLRNSGSKRWRTFESNTQGRIVLRKLTVRPSGQFYLASQVSWNHIDRQTVTRRDKSHADNRTTALMDFRTTVSTLMQKHSDLYLAWPSRQTNSSHLQKVRF